jgi:hypothetical protein
MGGISEFITQTKLKTSLSHGDYSGITSLVKVDSNARGKFALLHTTASGYVQADASSATTAPGTVIALEKGTGDDIRVLRRGYLRNTNWSFTRGANLYLDTYPGKIRQTAPSGPNDIVQCIGIAYDTDIIDFKPDRTTVTIDGGAATTTTTTTVAPPTTTTTTQVSQWYTVESSDFWESDTTDATFSNGYWINNTNDGTYHLVDIGTWTRGYRPTKIRITFKAGGDPEQGRMSLYDASGNMIANSGFVSLSNNVYKTVELDITFQGTTSAFDIDKIYHEVSADGPFTIKTIDFYGKYLPGSQVPTTTTTTATKSWHDVNSSAYWGPNDANTQWLDEGEGSQWASQSNVGFIDIKDIGTWTSGYRPTQVRANITVHAPTGTVSSSVQLMLYDASNNMIGYAVLSNVDTAEHLYTSNITFKGSTSSYDIDRIKVVGNVDTTPAYYQILVDDISFYSVSAPPTQTTTTTTTQAASSTTTTTTTQAASSTTTTTTTSAPTWVQHLDNTEWQNGGETWQCKWVTDHWEPGSASFSIELFPIGTWAVGLRPTKVRVTMSPSSASSLHLIVRAGTGDDRYELVSSGINQAISGVEYTLTFVGNFDISSLYIGGTGTDVDCYNIEFLV